MNPEVVLTIIKCETAGTWNPKKQSDYPNEADGGRELSFGLAQIHLPDHPDISLAQAEDPRFAIDFLVNNLAEGHGSMWSTYKAATNLECP